MSTLEKGGMAFMEYLKAISDVIIATINLVSKIVERSMARRTNDEH